MTAAPKENQLEVAIGRQVREYRIKLGMTVADLARQAGLSAGMLSKIENGGTSPSLATLQAMSAALNVPVTAFFRKFEEQRDATFVKAGQGLGIERRGTRAGHQYHLLGHSIGKSLVVEPYLVTLTETSDVFPIFQHSGQEFIYIVEGDVIYRHGDKLYSHDDGRQPVFRRRCAAWPRGIEETADPHYLGDRLFAHRRELKSRSAPRQRNDQRNQQRKRRRLPEQARIALVKRLLARRFGRWRGPLESHRRIRTRPRDADRALSAMAFASTAPSQLGRSGRSLDRRRESPLGSTPVNRRKQVAPSA